MFICFPQWPRQKSSHEFRTRWKTKLYTEQSVKIQCVLHTLFCSLIVGFCCVSFQCKYSPDPHWCGTSWCWPLPVEGFPRGRCPPCYRRSRPPGVWDALHGRWWRRKASLAAEVLGLCLPRKNDYLFTRLNYWLWLLSYSLFNIWHKRQMTNEWQLPSSDVNLILNRIKEIRDDLKTNRHIVQWYCH